MEGGRWREGGMEKWMKRWTRGDGGREMEGGRGRGLERRREEEGCKRGRHN